MNVLEMVYQFQKLLETVDSTYEVEQKIDTDTIIQFLNTAYQRYINQEFLSKDTMSDNIDHLQKRSADLKNLIKRASATCTAIGFGPYTGIGYTVSLTSIPDYLYYMRSDSYINRTAIYPTGTGQYAWINNTIAKSYDEVEKVLTTPFNKPVVREPLVIFEQNDTIILIVDSYTTLNTDEGQGLYLTYLAKPKYLSLVDSATTTTTCELAWQTHEEIVKQAVEIYVKEYKYILSQKQGK